MARFQIDDELIRKLAELLDETGLTEIEFSEGDKRLRVAKSVAQNVVAAPAAAPAPAAEVAAPAVPAPAEAPGGGMPEGGVTSPMVGTAYLAPEPGAPNFVKVGDTVAEGQTLVIIEAMKVMNPIRAPRAGTVTKILVDDAQPVEFGEVLMVVA
ncbi:MAG: acetyl-CoA carboxylase biotin carboxyl carrier protein [Pseudomonadota bacterium]